MTPTLTKESFRGQLGFLRRWSHYVEHDVDVAVTFVSHTTRYKFPYHYDGMSGYRIARNFAGEYFCIVPNIGPKL